MFTTSLQLFSVSIQNTVYSTAAQKFLYFSAVLEEAFNKLENHIGCKTTVQQN
jgi:hypothetical protein